MHDVHIWANHQIVPRLQRYRGDHGEHWIINLMISLVSMVHPIIHKTINYQRFNGLGTAGQRCLVGLGLRIDGYGYTWLLWLAMAHAEMKNKITIIEHAPEDKSIETLTI